MTTTNLSPREDLVGRRLVMATLSRAATLVISGVPTLVAWGIISKQLGASDFAGVALALSVPTVINFILPALGARMANSAAIGSDPFHEAVASSKISLRNQHFPATTNTLVDEMLLYELYQELLECIRGRGRLVSRGERGALVAAVRLRDKVKAVPPSMPPGSF